MPTFKHKLSRRFKIGRFEFKNHILSLQNDDDIEEFMRLVTHPKFPNRERTQIIEINEEAVRTLEKPLSLTVRGAQQTTDIKAVKTPESVTPASPAASPGIQKAQFTGLTGGTAAPASKISE